MRKAEIYVNGKRAGFLEEVERGKQYIFRYLEDYKGTPVSLTMPVSTPVHAFDGFPPFFDGVLPEGVMLEGLLRSGKLDRDDLFGQLIAVGGDLVGAVTVVEGR
ncbi:MAG TPA: HipA N-terminal domain-containing protein [Bacteroidota bacterium]|nr:HipA N-terminal domain-containing protein [Bacteroidota bacterium]